MPYRLAIAQQPIWDLRWIQDSDPGIQSNTIWRANQLRYIHHERACGDSNPGPTAENAVALSIVYATDT